MKDDAAKEKERRKKKEEEEGRRKEKNTATKTGAGLSYMLFGRKDLVLARRFWVLVFQEIQGKTADELKIEVQTKLR